MCWELNKYRGTLFLGLRRCIVLPLLQMRSNSLKYQQKGIQTSLTRRIWRKLRGIVREVAILDDFTLQNDNGRKRGYLCTKNCPIAHFLLETYEDKGFKQAGTFPLPYAHEYREL